MSQVAKIRQKADLKTYSAYKISPKFERSEC